MPLYSIDHLLTKILAQPQWEKQKRYHELYKCWYQVINHKFAQHSRPVALNNNVLFIATYSSVWAQELTLQRQTLLLKINRRIELPIKDLHFASVKWYQNLPISQDEEDTVKKHPSSIEPELSLNLLPKDNPQEMLEHWLTIIKKRSQNWAKCPRCQTNCPLGELKRWNVCLICFQKEAST